MISSVAKAQEVMFEIGTARSRGSGASKHSGMPWRRVVAFVGGPVIWGDEVFSRLRPLSLICAQNMLVGEVSEVLSKLGLRGSIYLATALDS